MEHLQVSGKDGAVLVAQLTCDGSTITIDFTGNSFNGRSESFQFVLDDIARNEATRNSKSLVVDYQRFTYGNAR